jgi:CheY-like chemotaxis protein
LNIDMDSKNNKKVFLVDDDTDTLALLSCLFESANAKVVECSIATKAIEQFTSHSSANGAFDLVVLDIRMAGINGNDLAKLLREQGYKGPLVALTAAASGVGRNTSKGSGFDHYLGKSELSSKVIAALLS